MENYDIQCVPQPQNMKINLYVHQLAMIYKMERLEREQKTEKGKVIQKTKIGINAEITGYGKTLSMIGLILRDKMEWDTDIRYRFEYNNTESAGLINTVKITNYDRIKTTLILVSPSIVFQWVNELSYTNLKVATITREKDIQINVTDYDVVITTPDHYNPLVMLYPNNAWKRFIFDEPGHMKVQSMEEIRAGFYWFVTATPSSIAKNKYNKGSFMYDIVGYDKGFEDRFSNIILQNDPNFVKSSFNMPDPIHYYYICSQPILRTVHGMVNSSIQTMIAAGNIEGAIVALGGTKTKNIVEIVRTNKLIELEKIESNINICAIKNDNKNLKSLIEKKERIKNQIIDLDKRFSEMLADNCSICLGALTNPVLEPNCQHLFCGECLLHCLQLKSSCPLCRTNIQCSDLVYVSKVDEHSIDGNTEKSLTRTETIIKLLQDNPNGKFLIFSDYDDTFNPIRIILKEIGINYSEIKGDSKIREKKIKSYTEGDTQVLFFNSKFKFNGVGINLQNTTDIILYHDMDEPTEKQNIGRANRIGRVNSLRVHHLQVNI